MTAKHTGLVDIGCLVRVTEDTPLSAAALAMALAAGAGAHLSLSLVVQTLKAPYSPLWSGVGSAMAKEVNEKAAAKADSLRESIEAQASAAGVAAEITDVMGPLGETSIAVGDAARAVDLVVIDQPHGPLDGVEALLEEALFRSGRPVLVASPAQAPFATVRRIVLGWDGSAHAVRACAEALALFPTLEEIEVVTVTGERKRGALLPAASFTRHLARKGVKARLTELPLGHGRISAILGARAVETGADLIAMGAFGHSRLREFLLGGTTVELTRDAPVALLLVA